MSHDDRLHDPLPRYLSGGLDADEVARFREHLADCDECRAEEEFVIGLREHLESHGDDFLEDHPPPDRLVAFVGGELGGDEARAVERHLGICETCPEEVRWISGDSVAAPAPTPQPRAGWPPWAWFAAAAAVVLIVLTPLTFVRPSPSAVFPESTVLSQVELADRSGNEIVLRPGESGWTALFPVDLPESGFPARIVIVRDSGDELGDTAIESREELVNGLFRLVRCDRCPPDEYAIRIDPADDSPPETIPVRVVEVGK